MSVTTSPVKPLGAVEAKPLGAGEGAPRVAETAPRGADSGVKTQPLAQRVPYSDQAYAQMTKAPPASAARSAPLMISSVTASQVVAVDVALHGDCAQVLDALETQHDFVLMLGDSADEGWSRLSDLNRRPMLYESIALPLS